MRMIGWEIFQSGWSRSQKISKIQKLLHPHKFLKTQIRKGPRKCQKSEWCTPLLLTSQNPEIATSAWEPNNMGSLQETHWRSSTTRREVWWFDDSWSQSPDWGVWIKKQSQIRCRGSRSCLLMDPVLSVSNQKKKKTSQETEKCLRKFLGPSEKPKVIYTDNALEFGKSCQHLINLRRMALLSERYAEWKKEHQPYWYSQDWMRDGGLVLWNAFAICEMSKISCLMGRLLMKEDSENHSKVP